MPLPGSTAKKTEPTEDISAHVTRIRFMGCPVDALDMAQTIRRIEEFIRDRKPRQHVVVNAAKLVEIQGDEELRQIICSCDLINADGMPIVWASRLLGTPLPARVAGSDLFQNLVRVCAEKGYRPFFFGARQWVVERVVEVFKARYPALDVAGFRNGYYSEEEEPGIAEMIRDSKADILFVGFSSPKKEKFLRKWMSVMQVPFSMGVGGSFDVIAGLTKRAPLWMQNCGLEWFYRFLQEPRRLWKRYLTTNSVFVYLLIKELLKNRV